MIRKQFTAIVRNVLVGAGVPDKKVEEYRDIALALPTIVAIILASKPVFYFAAGDRVSFHDTEIAFVWLVVALGVCLLSENWNHVLAAAWSFLALRGIVAIVASKGDPQVVAATTAFVLLAFASIRLKQKSSRH